MSSLPRNKPQRVADQISQSNYAKLRKFWYLVPEQEFVHINSGLENPSPMGLGVQILKFELA